MRVYWRVEKRQIRQISKKIPKLTSPDLSSYLLPALAVKVIESALFVCVSLCLRSHRSTIWCHVATSLSLNDISWVKGLHGNSHKIDKFYAGKYYLRSYLSYAKPPTIPTLSISWEWPCNAHTEGLSMLEDFHSSIRSASIDKEFLSGLLVTMTCTMCISLRRHSANEFDPCWPLLSLMMGSVCAGQLIHVHHVYISLMVLSSHWYIMFTVFIQVTSLTGTGVGSLADLV